MNGPVEAGENSLDYGVGAHGKGDLAELAHDRDNAGDNAVRFVCVNRHVRGTAGFAIEFLYLSQRKRVEGEGVDFGSG